MTYGRTFSAAVAACDALNEEMPSQYAVLKLNQITPLDPNAIESVLRAKSVFFFEEGIESGGIGETFGADLLQNGYQGIYSLTAVPNEFVVHASVAAQLKRYKLDCDGMIEVIKNGRE